MPAGPGAYDDLANWLHAESGAGCSALLIVGGKHGHSASVKVSPDKLASHGRLPEQLLLAARATRRGAAGENRVAELTREVYRGFAELLLEQTEAVGVVIVIVDGKEGSAFTILGEQRVVGCLPLVLEGLAAAVKRETATGEPVN